MFSTDQFIGKKHGSWQFVLQLQFFLWEYLTSFPEIHSFWFRFPKPGMEPMGSSWHRMICISGILSDAFSYPEAQFQLFFRLLLRSHQVCKNLVCYFGRLLQWGIVFILWSAWNLCEFPFSESVSRKGSEYCGLSVIITTHPTGEVL